MSTISYSLWEKIESLVGEINKFYKKLLMQCHLDSYSSFHGMRDEEMKSLFDQVQRYIKELPEDNSCHRELQVPSFSKN